MARKLNISVDYDGTYSADPETFEHIIMEFKQQGHNVYIVTARDAQYPVDVNPNLAVHRWRYPV